REAQSLESEKELFGYNHAQIGALIAKRWGLPEEIGFAIYSHHQPCEANQHIFMARLVDVGNQLAHAAEDGELQSHEFPISLSESVVALRLTWPQLQEAWGLAESKMGEMMNCIK
nr:HDOD domain-containing protein [Acidobacteriota bacterium]